MNSKKAKILRAYCKKHGLPYKQAKKQYKMWEPSERLKLLKLMKLNLGKTS